MLGYCFSQTQTYQHAFTRFVLLTVQRRSSKRIKFSWVLCWLVCYVGFGENFCLWTTPFPLLPSCNITDHFSASWHFSLLRSLVYFYFLKGNYQCGLFRFSLLFLSAQNTQYFLLLFFFFSSFCLMVDVVKSRLDGTWNILKFAYIYLWLKSLLIGNYTFHIDFMQMWKEFQSILRF